MRKSKLTEQQMVRIVRETDKTPVSEVAKNVHRKFWKAAVTTKDEAAREARLRIPALFKLEESWADLAPKQRHDRRQRALRAIVDDFFAWADKLSLREDVAKESLLRTLDEKYRNPRAILELRKPIAEKLGALSREANSEGDERRERLRRTEEDCRPRPLHQPARPVRVRRKALVDLEAHAKTERAAIDALVKRAAKPVELPSPDVVLRKLVAFRKGRRTGARSRATPDVLRAGTASPRAAARRALPREERLLPDAGLPVRPRTDRLTTPTKDAGPQPGGMWSSWSCAGRI